MDHHFLGTPAQEGLDPAVAVSVNSIMGQLVEEPLAGDDIEGFGEIQNSYVNL